MVAVAVEFTGLGVVAVGDTDEDPHEDDRRPTSETVVTLEEAFRDSSVCMLVDITRKHILVVVGTNPGSGREHRHVDDYQGDDTPGQDDSRSVLGDVVLECADDEEEEPSDTTGSAARVNTTNVLDETGQENTPPERGPLQTNESVNVDGHDVKHI